LEFSCLARTALSPTEHRSHTEADDGDYVPGTAEERLAQVWELTRERPLRDVATARTR
jgi:hypothetical protein